jgi:cytochrome d ubiquinol oxidase subunit II
MEPTISVSLPLVWLVIIGFFLLYYAVTDGFALGIGMISLFCRSDDERSLLMASIESTWHDHQTWLVLLGGMLFGAFPVFYSLVLSSLYIPIVAMLFGLVFRGVSFEFRALATRNKYFWGLAFGFGSLAVTAAQGFALGGLLGGLQIIDDQFVGSVWGWLNPFSALVTFGVICGYVMLGANFLILKTEGDVSQRSYRISLTASIFTLIISLIVHGWVAAKYPHVGHKWTARQEVFPMALFLVPALLSYAFFIRSILKRQELAPLLWNAALILFSFIGLSISLYPVMIPNLISPITVEAAAASTPTLMFMLVATAILLPVILVYTGHKYRVFRGKVHSGGYAESEE